MNGLFTFSTASGGHDPPQQDYPQLLSEIRQEHEQTGANPVSVSETGAGDGVWQRSLGKLVMTENV